VSGTSWFARHFTNLTAVRYSKDDHKFMMKHILACLSYSIVLVDEARPVTLDPKRPKYKGLPRKATQTWGFDSTTLPDGAWSQLNSESIYTEK
jgi:hypothetical protein